MNGCICNNGVGCFKCAEGEPFEGCAEATGNRYVVDYDRYWSSWGVVDAFSDTRDLFVGHTTTQAGARVQARKMNQQADVTHYGVSFLACDAEVTESTRYTDAIKDITCEGCSRIVRNVV